MGTSRVTIWSPTPAPVQPVPANPCSSLIRTVLAFAAAENLETSQIDIKGAYLNGELTAEETIYMCQPPCYQQGTMVCQLQKTLYGLKQWGRRWNQRLVEIMTEMKFLRCEVDQAVFY
jgi:hypothetical protein